MSLTAALDEYWEVTGALSVAPRSIAYARVLLWFGLAVAVVGSAVSLGFDQRQATALLVCSLLGLAAWQLWWRRFYPVSPQETRALRVTATGIDVLTEPAAPQAAANVVGSPLVLRGVIRHWAGMTLLCESPNQSKPVRRQFSLWREQFTPDEYRRLSVLLNWQTRGKT